MVFNIQFSRCFLLTIILRIFCDSSFVMPASSDSDSSLYHSDLVMPTEAKVRDAIDTVEFFVEDGRVLKNMFRLDAFEDIIRVLNLGLTTLPTVPTQVVNFFKALAHERNKDDLRFFLLQSKKNLLTNFKSVTIFVGRAYKNNQADNPFNILERIINEVEEIIESQINKAASAEENDKRSNTLFTQGHMHETQKIEFQSLSAIRTLMKKKLLSAEDENTFETAIQGLQLQRKANHFEGFIKFLVDPENQGCLKTFLTNDKNLIGQLKMLIETVSTDNAELASNLKSLEAILDSLSPVASPAPLPVASPAPLPVAAPAPSTGFFRSWWPFGGSASSSSLSAK